LVDDLNDEVCDLGNFNVDPMVSAVPYGGCTDDCGLGPHCGDGFTDEGLEECDDGAETDDGEYGQCTTECFLGPNCGDGTIQTIFGEACDNGFNDDTYAFADLAEPCADDCQLPPACGDGVLEPGFELCDYGEDNDDDTYDGCREDCSWGSYCGDGVRDEPEEDCDDPGGNVAYSASGAACGYDCKPAPYCGDSIRNGPEECDEGTSDNDGGYGGCNEDCTRGPFCGDRSTDLGDGEQCDDGPQGSLSCSPSCRTRGVR
jgi:hypothetical protein